MAEAARILPESDTQAPVPTPEIVDAARPFEAPAAGQVGAWHELIEARFAGQTMHADVYGQPGAVEETFAFISRLAGPALYCAGIAGLFIWAM